MTVEGTSNKSGPYRGNGSLRAWPIAVDLNGVLATEIYGYLVSEEGVSTLIEANYEVDLNAQTYTYPTVVSGLPALTSSQRILIVRTLNINQETDFVNQGAIPAEAIESALDRWAMVAQQLQEQVNRCAQSDISGSEQDAEIAALLNEVSGARDEATLAAAAASDDADLASASAIAAAASASGARVSMLSAYSYANAASISAISAAASAEEISSYLTVVNHWEVMEGDVATGTTIIPSDDTPPQSSEGDEYMTLEVTPSFASNILRIEIVAIISHSAGTGNIAALFQDSNTTCLACAAQYETAGNLVTINFTHFMTAGTTSATTFKVRCGNGGSGTTTFNGISGSRLFGGKIASSISVTELKI